MRGWGGMRGDALFRQFGRRNELTKNKRERDGAVALDGRCLMGGHNNQPKVSSGGGGDIGEGARPRRNVCWAHFAFFCCGKLSGRNKQE